MAENESMLNDAGIAISLSIILFGLALGLPYITLGDLLGLDFTTMPTSVITVLRLGIIGQAITIGLKPLDKKRNPLN